MNSLPGGAIRLFLKQSTDDIVPGHAIPVYIENPDAIFDAPEPSDLLNVGYIQFDTDFGETNHVEGQIHWNGVKNTLDVDLGGDVVLQVGQETHYFVMNQSGGLILNGTPVMFAGAVGMSGILKCTPAIANGTFPAHYMMGIATQDIANGETGKITWFGELRGLDTTGGDQGETWAQGDILYINPSVTGALTNIEPDAPDMNIPMAVVITRHKNVGELFVRPTFRFSTHELFDVNGNTPQTRYVLAWQGTYYDPEPKNLFNTRLVSTTGNILLTDSTLRVDTTDGNVTLTLPNVNNTGITYTIKKVAGANNVIVDTPTTIDGDSDKTISDLYGVLRVQSNGTTWDVV